MSLRCRLLGHKVAKSRRFFLTERFQRWCRRRYGPTFTVRAYPSKVAIYLTVHGNLAKLDREGITGELLVREVRSGRVPVEPMWGRPESVRREFATRYSQ